MNPPRALPVALAVLAGWAIGIGIVTWQLDAANDRYSAAIGYDDGRADSLDDTGCRHRYDTGSPLLSAPSLDLDAWLDGCQRHAHERATQPPVPPCAVGCPGPAGFPGGAR